MIEIQNSANINETLDLLKLDADGLEVEISIKQIPQEYFFKGELENEEAIEESESIIEKLNQQIDKLTNHATGVDYTIAIGAGIIGGIIDSLWVGEFSLKRGKSWSNRTVNEFVMEVAKKTGFKGNRLDKAIKHLEDKFPVPSDNVWKDKQGGISARSHHLDDLSHHPTLLGLLFSFLTQFTGKAYFSNRDGTFQILPADGHVIGADVLQKLLFGSVNWMFHLASDMSGSKKTAGAGMGIPGPIVSILKELSMLPGLRDSGLPQKLHDMFVKEHIDLRTELAVGHELGRQTVPVLITQALVMSGYCIRQVINEYNKSQTFRQIEWKYVVPSKNRTLVRMMTIASGVGVAIDLGDAAIRAAIQSNGLGPGFMKRFLLRINFVGLGTFVCLLITDIGMGIKRAKLRRERMEQQSKYIYQLQGRVFYRHAHMWKAAQDSVLAIQGMEETQLIARQYISGTWDLYVDSIQKIGKLKPGIEVHNPGLCDYISGQLK